MDAPVGGERFLFGNFRLEPLAGRLFRRDATGEWQLVPIGARALDILGVLLKSPGVVVSRDAIVDAVWAGIAVERGSWNGPATFPRHPAELSQHGRD